MVFETDRPTGTTLEGLETDRLTLSYGQQAVIQELSLQIPPGKITALVGPNGCGKSTLLKGLSRLLKPVYGQVYLDGRAFQDLSTTAIAQSLGILLQQSSAPDDLTVRELVCQGRYPHQRWLRSWSAQDEAQVQLALRITQLEDFSDRCLNTLSGGQQQRVWIALVLAQDTRILLLDEPTTFLDLAHQIEILDLLYELNAHQQKTIVMVLHDLNQACRYAHHLIVMQQGAIAAAGDPRTIITEDLLREIFQVQCKVFPDPLTGTPLCIPVAKHMQSLSD